MLPDQRNITLTIKNAQNMPQIFFCIASVLYQYVIEVWKVLKNSGSFSAVVFNETCFFINSLAYIP